MLPTICAGRRRCRLCLRYFLLQSRSIIYNLVITAKISQQDTRAAEILPALCSGSLVPVRTTVSCYGAGSRYELERAPVRLEEGSPVQKGYRSSPALARLEQFSLLILLFLFIFFSSRSLTNSIREPPCSLALPSTSCLVLLQFTHVSGLRFGCTWLRLSVSCAALSRSVGIIIIGPLSTLSARQACQQC
jgi:hypothetical protein